METDAARNSGPNRPLSPKADPIDDLAGKFERCGRFLTYRLGRKRAQWKILNILREEGPVSQRALQERLGVQPGSMSEIACKLEGRGLLERFRDGADRRKVRLRLTDQGRQWLDLQEDGDHVLRRRAELFSALTGEERQTLETLLEKLGEDWARRFARERPPEERGREESDRS